MQLISLLITLATIAGTAVASFNHVQTEVNKSSCPQLKCNAVNMPLQQGFVKIGDSEYLVSDKKMNWFQAWEFCRTHNADLATIQSAAEHKALSDHLKSIGKTYDDWFWFDGNDLGKEGQFHSLATGQLLAFTKWSGGQPDNNGGNENCAHLWSDEKEFLMNDWVCTASAHFICQAKQSRTIALQIYKCT